MYCLLDRHAKHFYLFATRVINMSLESKPHKFILIGSVGSGKTTSIKAVSEIDIISTESRATESDALHRKATTTTAMDFGQLTLDEQKIRLYGAPGQRRFDFMVPVLSVGSSGLIVMIDNGIEKPLEELDYYLKAHKDLLNKIPTLIVVTHYDDNETSTSLLDYHLYIIKRGFSIPVMTCDARSANDVKKVLKRLLNIIDEINVLR